MLFVLERVTVKQEAARKIIAHSTSKLKAQAVPPRANTQRPLRPKTRRRPSIRAKHPLAGEAQHCVTSVDILARSSTSERSMEPHGTRVAHEMDPTEGIDFEGVVPRIELTSKGSNLPQRAKRRCPDLRRFTRRDLLCTWVYI